MPTLLHFVPSRSLSGLVVVPVFLGLLFVYLFTLPAVAFTQQQSSECVGLDIVFLIDESRSMAENDRFGVRGDAIRTAIDILGDNAVYFCPDVQHRIAVLGFGGGTTADQVVQPYVASFTISPALDSLGGWKIQRDEIKRDIPSDNYLGATNHLVALQTAAATLQQWKQEPIGDAARKRGMVLITDGGPCPIVVDSQCQWGDFQSERRYLDALEAFSDPLGSDLPWRGSDNDESVFLGIIVFNDATGSYAYLDNDPALLSTWTNVSRSHGGDLFRMPRQEGVEVTPETANAALTGIVANILNPVLGSNLVPWDCQEPIWIDPYLSNVTIIHVFRRGADPGLGLQDVNVRIKAERGGQTVAEFDRGSVVEGHAQVNDYTQDGPNERYVLYLPPPGKYIVEATGADKCKDLDVRFGTTNIQKELLSPTEGVLLPQVDTPPYVDPIDPTSFSFRLWQQGAAGEQQPLQENPDYPLSFSLYITGPIDSPLSATRPYTIALTEPGLYNSSTPLRTQHAGKYNWQLVATTRNPREEASPPDTTPITILEETGSFAVVPVDRFGFRIVEPVAGAEVSLNTISDGELKPLPVAVTLELVDQNDKVLDSSEVLTGDVAQAFSARIRGPGGQLEETVPLTPDLSRPGTFIAQMRQSQVAGSEIDPPGEYLLQVSFAGEYDRLRYSPNIREASLRFNRVELQPLDIVAEIPQNLKLHGSGLACVQGRLNSFPIAIRLVNPITKAFVNPVDAFDSDSDPLQAFKAVVTNRNRDEREQAIFQQVDRAGDVFFIGQAGENMDASGTYTVAVELLDTPLNARYAWVAPEKTVQFVRSDGLDTNPLACRGLTGLVSAIILGLLILIMYLLTGAPRGSIALVKPDTSPDNPDNIMVGPIRLRSFGRTQTKRSRALKNAGVKKITVSKASSTEPNGRAIHVAAQLVDGSHVYPMVLDKDTTSPFVESGDIAYS